MTLFAPIELSGGRRPDQPPVALLFDRSDVSVDPKQPFVAKVGRRMQSGAVVRLNAVFMPEKDADVLALSVRFGNKEGRLAYSAADHVWRVESDDSDGPIAVAGSPLLEGVSYAVSLTADFGSMTWRDVVVDGRRVPVQVIDEIEGMPKAPEEFVVDVMNGGLDVAIPEWAAEIVRSYSAEDLLALAREQGGRIVCRRQPPPDIEEVPRPAPLVSVEDGQPYFTFSVEGGPMTADRIWATEA